MKSMPLDLLWTRTGPIIPAALQARGWYVDRDHWVTRRRRKAELDPNGPEFGGVHICGTAQRVFCRDWRYALQYDQRNGLRLT